MDNSNLREDQKKAIREVLMMVTAAHRTLEIEKNPGKAESLLGEAVSRLVELAKAKGGTPTYMSSPLSPLESRTLSSGLAKRTLKNLEFIQQAFDRGEDVHVVTQSLNSLLGLLMLPAQKETSLFETFSKVKFRDPLNLSDICATLSSNNCPCPSLQVAMFGRCEDLGKFFRRIRNAVSHKHLEWSGDPDSPILADVKVTLKDRPNSKGKHREPPPDFDWKVTMTAEDLEKLSRYVANKVIEQGL